MAADEADKSYSLEPSEPSEPPERKPEPEPDAPGDAEAPETPSSPEAAPPAADEPPGPGSVHDLDVCPNCGAPMRGADELLCLRCGFDLKTMQVIETKKGEVVADEAGKPAPVVRAGFGDGWLPWTLAGIAGAMLVVGYLAGVKGLFRFPEPVEVVRWPDRMLGLVREPVVMLMGVLCVLAGLTASARVWSRPLGDVLLAAPRVIGMVAVARLAAFTDLRWVAGEVMLEIVLQAAVLFLGLLALFRLTPKQSLTVLGASVTALFTIYLTALLITWAL